MIDVILITFFVLSHLILAETIWNGGSYYSQRSNPHPTHCFLVHNWQVLQSLEVRPAPCRSYGNSHLPGPEEVKDSSGGNRLSPSSLLVRWVTGPHRLLACSQVLLHSFTHTASFSCGEGQPATVTSQGGPQAGLQALWGTQRRVSKFMPTAALAEQGMKLWAKDPEWQQGEPGDHMAASRPSMSNSQLI